MTYIWFNILTSALKRVIHPTDTQNEMLLSKFSCKDGSILVFGVIVFFILTHYIGVFGSSVLLGVIVARSCWIISSRERNDTIQQFNMVIDRLDRENEHLKSQISQHSYRTNKLQDKMMIQHQRKQLESENKLREEKHLSKQKCDEVERNMEKFITRYEDKKKEVAISLQEQRLQNQKYNNICAELSENLNIAHNERKWIESQLQASISDMQKEQRMYEENEKMYRIRLQKLEAENKSLKEIQKKYEENVIKLQGLQNTVSTTYKELERMKSEKISWTAKSNEIKQTIKDMEKAQLNDFYSKRQVDAIYKLSSAKTDYERLGIRLGATRVDVNTAYKKLSILVHPDKNAAPGSEEAFRILHSAKNTLLKKCC
ncbi:DNAJC27 [Mytilus coruscus]|uniref:DNAJC27 n=1 Tax=Mytilus coruscus TaxID=42192 RepID=A0A6J8AIH1_MYTCO|nr:DNAJC27 [Mytilus coruscus]